ncbi:hypothetical protein JD844_012147 [Phrynosoma platyrhinos]|uniref:Uncharacterized protein n=1 Tax=Phrynosoma platyrhinos TaxID=52577 RepID=A0ABQ7TK77_PHRPL|nr:hypothetical protein JD844_012147 [Phrynosoma platyrhinos]
MCEFKTLMSLDIHLMAEGSSPSVLQVRNLCYMVTRREKMKHSICKLQEQIFHLQMKLIEKDLYPGVPTSYPNLKGMGIGNGNFEKVVNPV